MPHIQAALKALKALKKIRGAMGESGGIPAWAIVLVIILALLNVMMMISMIMLPIIVAGIVAKEVLDIPGMGAIAKVGCWLGSDKACFVDEVKSLSEDYGVTDSLKEATDCASLPPDWPRDWCDAAADDLTEEGQVPNPIPADFQWMIPIYQDAAAHYDVDWKLLASVHATRNRFGKKNCPDQGGHYFFTDYEWDTYKVDVGNEYVNDRKANCVVHEEHVIHVKGKPKRLHYTYNEVDKEKKKPVVDEGPEGFDDDENFDAPDAIFAEARMLKKLGAEKAQWNYNGAPAASCTQSGRFDRLYSYSSAGTLKGPPSPYDDLIIAAATKYNMPAALLKGIIKTESGFDPNAGSGQANGLTQFTPATWATWSVKAGFAGKPTSDPEASVFTGAAYISSLMNQYKDARTGLAAYNGGNVVDTFGPIQGDPRIIEDIKDFDKYYDDRGLPYPTDPSSWYVQTRQYAFIKVPTAAMEFGWDGKTYQGSGLPPKAGEVVKFKGKKATDKVSLIIGTYTTEDGKKKKDTDCYIATAWGWYDAIAQWEVATGGVSIAVEGTPKYIIDTIVVPLAVKNHMSTGITPAMVDAANAAHSVSTTSGNKSDHKGPPQTNWAADISNGTNPTPEMDQLAVDISKAFGIPWSGSGLVNHTAGGYRYQLIYRTNEGGNHYNHVHIGIRKLTAG